MTYSKAKRDYNVQYIKDNIKRIPLDVQKDRYEKIKAAADAAGESVNGYIKRAIDERMERAENPFILEETETQVIRGEEYDIYYRKRIPHD